MWDMGWQIQDCILYTNLHNRHGDQRWLITLQSGEPGYYFPKLRKILFSEKTLETTIKRINLVLIDWIDLQKSLPRQSEFFFIETMENIKILIMIIEGTRTYYKKKVVTNMFWLFNTVSDSTDSWKFGHKTEKCGYRCPNMVKHRLSMSRSRWNTNKKYTITASSY